MDEKIIFQNLNSIIKLERKKQNITLRTLSKICNVDYSFLSRIEHGYIASEEIYICICNSMGLDFESVIKNLEKENKFLLMNLTKWCRLEQCNSVCTIVECVDSLLNLLLVEVQNSICSAFRHDVSMEDIFNSAKELYQRLDYCIDAMTIDQKQLFLVLCQFYYLLNNEHDKIGKIQAELLAISKSKYINLFCELNNSLVSYYKGEYVTAIIKLYELKTIMAHDNLWQWSVVIDMIMARICYKINDITALELYMDGLIKFCDESLIVHDVLEEMLKEFKKKN